MVSKKFSKTFDDVLNQSYMFQAELLVDQTAFTAFSPGFAAPYATNFLNDIHAADALPTNEDDLNTQTLCFSPSKIPILKRIYEFPPSKIPILEGTFHVSCTLTL